MNIIHSVFDIQYFDRDDEKKKQQLENEQYDLFYAPNDGENNAIAIKKRRIKKITDLTLENVSHLTPEDILTLIENNMGTGWKGLPLAIQDIIESAFYVDVSLLPEAAMHRKGGIIDRKRLMDMKCLSWKGETGLKPFSSSRSRNWKNSSSLIWATPIRMRIRTTMRMTMMMTTALTMRWMM